MPHSAPPGTWDSIPLDERAKFVSFQSFHLKKNLGILKYSRKPIRIKMVSSVETKLAAFSYGQGLNESSLERYGHYLMSTRFILHPFL